MPPPSSRNRKWPASPVPQDPAPVIALTGDFQFGRGQRTVQPQVQSRMLIWCKAGRGRVVVNGAAFVLEPKDAVFVPWNRHLVYEADAANPFLVGGVHVIPRHDRQVPLRFFVPHSAQDPLTDCDFRADTTLPELEGTLQARFTRADPLELLAEYLVAKFRHAAVGAGATAPAAADLVAEAYQLAPIFLQEAVRCFRRRPDGAAHGALPLDLVRLLRFIDNHLSDPVSLADLARFSGLSRSNIGRLFRRHLQTTPVNWITGVKIEAAKRLLATGTTPIGKIGARVGIGDPFYFSKLFKKTTGLSAKTYRRAASLV